MHRRLFVVALALAFSAPSAWAAAEVHRLNLVLSAIPTEIKGGDFNDDIDYINRTTLEALGLEGLDNVTYGWLFDAELRYFLRPGWAVTAGVGQLKQQTRREYLPALQQQIQIRQEILSVPIRLGAAYYFEPYNQGDFQARAFIGGGLLSLSQNRVTSQVYSTFGTGSLVRWNGSGPGFYGEGGVQMFFASRLSVIISALYRDSQTSTMLITQGDPSILNQRATSAHSGGTEPYQLDASGLGLRMAVAFGL